MNSFLKIMFQIWNELINMWTIDFLWELLMMLSIIVYNTFYFCDIFVRRNTHANRCFTFLWQWIKYWGLKIELGNLFVISRKLFLYCVNRTIQWWKEKKLFHCTFIYIIREILYFLFLTSHQNKNSIGE